jgi:hypothetical protein
LFGQWTKRKLLVSLFVLNLQVNNEWVVAYQRIDKIYKLPLLILRAVYVDLHLLEQKADPPLRGLTLQTLNQSNEERYERRC